MAISKLILNGEVQMDVTSDTVEANKLLEGETATKNDGTKVTGTFVAPDPVISSLSVTPTESAQTFNEASISGYKPVTIAAIASDYVGSAIPMRSSADVTITGRQISGLSGYYSLDFNAVMSLATFGMEVLDLDKSTGYIQGQLSVTHSGYTASSRDWPFSYQLSTISASTITPTESVQYISSYRWLTGSQTIAAIPSAYIIPSGTSAITSNGTFDIASYASASVNVVPNLVSKSVTPTESEQVITAGSLYTRVDGSFKTGESRETAAKAFSQISSAASTLIADTYIISGTIDIYNEDRTTLYQTLTINENDWEFSRISGSRTTMSFSKSNTNNYIDDLAISYYSTTGCALWYSKVSLTKLSLVVNLTFYTKDADGLSQVTVNAISSSYIIPIGTSSITSNGVYDIGDYKSVDVNVAGGGDTTIEDAVIGGIPAAVSIYSNDRILSIRYATCQYINASVFDVPNVSYIGPYAFSDNSYVNTVLTSKLLNVSSHAFRNCTNLENIDLSPVLFISEYAFSGTKLSSSLTLSYLVSMSQYAFLGCDLLPLVSLPYYNMPINLATFHVCDVLSEFYAPFATTIGSSAFNQCTILTKCNAITAREINAYAFSKCSNLSSIAFGAQKIGPVTIGSYAFSGCKKLHDVYICNRLSGSGTIQAYAFSGCTSLSNLYILSPSYVSLAGSTAFRSTPIQSSTTGYGSIYVPAALYDSYISGSYWSYFSDRFVSLTSSEVDAIFDSLSEVNLWSYQEADPATYISSRQVINGGYKSLNQLIGKQAEYKLLLNNNPGGQTATYLYSMAIFSQILLQSYTTFTAIRPSLNLDFSLHVDLENNTVSYNFNSGTIYGFSFWLRCL